MKIDNFELVNEVKVKRAIEGTLGQRGELVGGLGPKASPKAVLAEYDRLGGYIRKDGLKIKMGTFYDFKKKVAFENPKLVFEASVDGDLIDVNEAEAKALASAKKK